MVVLTRIMEGLVKSLVKLTNITNCHMVIWILDASCIKSDKIEYMKNKNNLINLR